MIGNSSEPFVPFVMSVYAFDTLSGASGSVGDEKICLIELATGSVQVNADESPLPPRSLVASPERPPSEIFPETAILFNAAAVFTTSSTVSMKVTADSYSGPLTSRIASRNVTLPPPTSLERSDTSGMSLVSMSSTGLSGSTRSLTEEKISCTDPRRRPPRSM